jgi:hypothetical protein
MKGKIAKIQGAPSFSIFSPTLPFIIFLIHTLLSCDLSIPKKIRKYNFSCTSQFGIE